MLTKFSVKSIDVFFNWIFKTDFGTAWSSLLKVSHANDNAVAVEVCDLQTKGKG